MLNRKCKEGIAEWINTNEKLKEINNYLFENTELFEQKYEDEYRTELYKFFAGKITRFSRDYNQLMELLEQQEITEINWERIKLK